MARSRNIKPGFFKNEDLAECTPWARLCFAGLWTLADREGRLEDRPKRIKGELFAFDSVEVEPLLQELAKAGFVLRYGANGGRFIQIPAFHKHQNPHHKESKSAIPAPQSPGLSPHAIGSKPEAYPALHEGQTPGEPEASPGLQCDERAKHGGKTVLIPDSGFLIPESSTSRAKARGSPAVPAGFDAFWAAYPRKVAKPAAAKAFAKIEVDAQLQALMLAAIERQSQSEQWRRDGGQFIPHPSTWLNGKRWLDEVASTPTAVDESRPAWATRAGFVNRFEAENAGCFEHNAELFSDGQRQKEGMK